MLPLGARKHAWAHGTRDTPSGGREQTGAVVDVQRNPHLRAALTDALIEIWTAVTNAGGAVGFLADTSAAEVRPVAERAFARVAAGRDDLIVALDDSQPVGFAFLGPLEHPLSSHCGVVKRLQRDPRRRGAGIGGAVLAGVEQAAIDRGFRLLTLTVRGGTGREGFYAAHGYRVDGRLPARLLLNEGEMVEEIHMSKPLAEGVPTATQTLHVRRLDPDLPLPTYAHPGDAGLDLYAAEDVELAPGERAAVPTGMAVAIPQGCVGLVHPRSGLAARHGVSIVNAPGTIDAGYRGEVKVLLVNLDRDKRVRLARGERIAQLLVQQVEQVRVVEVTSLEATARGEGGFGSTGR